MKIPRTDYSQIAEVYDLGWKGRAQDLDPDLARIGREKSPVFALDVGCGTGNYIQKQILNQRCLVEWTGVDPTDEMLRFGRDKVPDARWIICSVEDLVLPDEAFDYVYSSFTYHHFEDRERAFDEMVRVLKPGGMIKLHNICPEFMKNHCLYRYFETTRETDSRRHPSLHRLVDAFKTRGLEVDAYLSVTYPKYARFDYIERIERRDNSMLAILDDELYKDGLQRVYDLEDPEVTDEVAMVTVRATMPGDA